MEVQGREEGGRIVGVLCGGYEGEAEVGFEGVEVGLVRGWGLEGEEAGFCDGGVDDEGAAEEEGGLLVEDDAAWEEGLLDRGLCFWQRCVFPGLEQVGCGTLELWRVERRAVESVDELSSG